MVMLRQFKSCHNELNVLCLDWVIISREQDHSVLPLQKTNSRVVNHVDLETLLKNWLKADEKSENAIK